MMHFMEQDTMKNIALLCQWNELKSIFVLTQKKIAHKSHKRNMLAKICSKNEAFHIHSGLMLVYEIGLSNVDWA